jgi:hypothetical protein
MSEAIIYFNKGDLLFFKNEGQKVRYHFANGTSMISLKKVA